MSPEEEILAKAADILDAQDHLAKGLFIDASGCVCALGAINRAAGLEPNGAYRPTSETGTRNTAIQAELALMARLGLVGSLAHWSDDRRRTTKSAARAIRKVLS